MNKEKLKELNSFIWKSCGKDFQDFALHGSWKTKLLNRFVEASKKRKTEEKK